MIRNECLAIINKRFSLKKSFYKLKKKKAVLLRREDYTLVFNKGVVS